MVSGTANGQTAMGFLPRPANVNTAANLGLTVSGGAAVTHLVSDGYGTDKNVAKGVGIRLYNSRGMSLNLLSTLANTGQGAIYGWYPVLDDASVISNANGVWEFTKEVAIKWSAAPDMTPQTVLYRRPVAQFSNFQPKIVSSWLILALFQANFLISGRSRLCPYQLVNSNQVRQGE
ncbi:putative fimbrial usher protein StbD [Providencia rustigianii]|nr:putative fimbrial usher protein StbD [Providencia rustigianii]